MAELLLQVWSVTPAMGATLFVFGFVIALLMHISGVGAGVLLVPALIVGFKLTPAQAVGTVGMYSILFRIGSLWALVKAGQVHTGAMWRFGLYALPSSIAAALLFGWIPTQYAALKSPLEGAVRFLIVIAASIALASLYWRQLKAVLGRLGLKFLGAFTGFLMGATGAGGGILIVPALLSATPLTPAQAVGTSNAISMGLTLATALIFGLSGAIRWGLLPALVVGAYCALPFANVLAKRLSQKTIVDTVAALIGVALLGMLATWLG